MRPKDPRAGIVLADPRVTARKVRIRRLKRRLKAAVSLGIAVAAGTFIACQNHPDKSRPNPAPNPTTDEVSNLPAPKDAAVDAAVDAADSPSDAATNDAAIVGPVRRPRDAAVDREEHRKGMPVPDNLLE